jgi:hypothetical protein
VGGGHGDLGPSIVIVLACVQARQSLRPALCVQAYDCRACNAAAVLGTMLVLGAAMDAASAVAAGVFDVPSFPSFDFPIKVSLVGCDRSLTVKCVGLVQSSNVLSTCRGCT